MGESSYPKPEPVPNIPPGAEIIVSPTQPRVSGSFVWVQTGLGPTGTDVTFWFVDNTYVETDRTWLGAEPYRWNELYNVRWEDIGWRESFIPSFVTPPPFLGQDVTSVGGVASAAQLGVPSQLKFSLPTVGAIVSAQAIGSLTVSSQRGIGIIALENERLSHVQSVSLWPNFYNNILPKAVLLTNAWTPYGTHSHPAYIGLAAGDAQTLGILDDSMKIGGAGGTDIDPGTGIAANNFFKQAINGGNRWNAYCEAMPTGDVTVSSVASGNGVNYIGRHFAPVADFSYMNNHQYDSATVGADGVKDAGSTVGFGAGTPAWPGLINDLNSSTPPEFWWFSPTPANQGHDGGPTTGSWAMGSPANARYDGDTFINKIVADVQATTWYARGGTVLIWWDEADVGAGTSPYVVSAGGLKPVAVLSKYTESLATRTDNTPVNDWGLLRDIEDHFGWPTLYHSADSGIGRGTLTSYWK